MITASEYIAAKDKLTHLEEWIQLINNRCLREDLEAERRCRAQVQTLEREYEAGRKRRSDVRDMASAPLIAEKEGAMSFLAEADQILRHLALKEEVEKTELTEPHPKFYHTKIEAEGELLQDEYTWIRYFIVRNKKPKNCYSLMALGNSKLRKLLERLHEYGMPAYENWYPIAMSLRDLPTVQELLTWLEKNRESSLIAYLGIRDRYIDTIRGYSAKDFEALNTIREATEEEAPVIFVVDYPGESSMVYRLHNGFYYSSLEGKIGEEMAQKDKDKLQYLRIGGGLYLRGGRAEGYTINETGNLTFGDWWSLSFQPGGTNTPFNKESWEKRLDEANAYVKEKTGEYRDPPKVNWHPPKITWIHPELIPKLT